MQVTIVGAGPAGLYAAILLKRWRSDISVHVLDKNNDGETYGFGVVLSDQALSFLRDDDPETVALVEPHLTRWSDIDVVLRGERISIDGIGFSGIGRKELLLLLRQRAEALGAMIEFGRAAVPADFLNADLVIGADGVHSTVRSYGNFGEEVTYLSNRFAWFGTTQSFERLTQTFIETEFGCVNAHHYSYAPEQSTFIVEMPPNVFERAGLSQRSEAQSRTLCETIFAPVLNDHPLIANRSVWRQFARLRCARWFDGRSVLVGDALHTAHFSIGSGTRLALEDVIALVATLREWDGCVSSALPAYQAARQPILEKLTRAADASGKWYDDFDRHMTLEPWAFAASYVQRSGRLAADRLQAMSPRFAIGLRQRDLL